MPKLVKISSVGTRIKLILALSIGAGIIFYFTTRPSDKSQIKAYLKKLAESASFENINHPFDQLGKVKEVSTLLASDFSADLLTTEGTRKAIKDTKDFLRAWV